MQTSVTAVLKEKDFKFFLPFLFYALGLGCYLSTLVPFMKKLIPQQFPQETLENIHHLDYIVAASAFLLLLFGVFFEGFVMFIVANILGAKVNIRKFLSIFMVANIPMALRLILISIKNTMVDNPTTNLIISKSHFVYSVFDLFNLSYLVILFFLLKYRTNLNNVMLSILIVVAFVYRMFF